MHAVFSQCTFGDVRLVGGSVPNEGTVEVCQYSVWGRVCDDQWNTDDARVVCRQLGYGTDGKCLAILYIYITIAIYTYNIAYNIYSVLSLSLISHTLSWHAAILTV